jgi:lipoprotein-releasing system ATP-binding protein
MLEVTRVGKQYPTPRGPLTVLADVSFALQNGQAASITGPSGSGKSSLLYILGALEPPTTGTVALDGQNPFALAPAAVAEFRNAVVGFVFQDHCLLPQCSVLENVLVPTLVAPRTAGSAGDEGADDRRHAERLLHDVGLSDRLDHRPGALSGGERQRVAVARALVRRPRLLLCDEPTGNLDQASAGAVAETLLGLHQSLQNILVVVTHSTTLAAAFPMQFEIRAARLERVR